MARPVFKYEPLEPKRSIRLLRISNSDRWDDPIALSLTTYPLIEGSIPEYTALSYTWGSSDRNVEVFIDEATTMITESLSQALQHLRKTQQQRDDIDGFWWVDMLCINQQCIPERNHQVAIMRDIFQGASLVVAWLGIDNWIGSDTDTNLVGEVSSQAGHRADAVHREGRPKTTTLDWHRERDIVNRPYWARVWIIQELCVARDIIIMSNSICISWSTFRSVLKEREQSTPGIRAWIDTHQLSVSIFRFTIPFHLVSLRDKVHNDGGKASLGSLLTFSSQSEATNPRDKVYSLLGLTNDVSEEKIPLDYSLSPCDVYCAAIRVVYEGLRSGSSYLMSEATAIMSRCFHNPFVVGDERRSQCDGFGCGAWFRCIDLALIDSEDDM